MSVNFKNKFSMTRNLGVNTVKAGVGEGNYITARNAIQKMLEEYLEAVKGLPNQPPVDEALIKELELKFNCDWSVAELACHKANFKSLELALDFIYGHDPQNLHKHPFVPFMINEKELNVASQNLEKATVGMNVENLMLDLTSPMIRSKPANEQRQQIVSMEDHEGHMATGELFTNQNKIRCFICKGKQHTHLNEDHREDLN